MRSTANGMNLVSDISYVALMRMLCVLSRRPVTPTTSDDDAFSAGYALDPAPLPEPALLPPVYAPAAAPPRFLPSPAAASPKGFAPMLLPAAAAAEFSNH